MTQGIEAMLEAAAAARPLLLKAANALAYNLQQRSNGIEDLRIVELGAIRDPAKGVADGLSTLFWLDVVKRLALERPYLAALPQIIVVDSDLHACRTTAQAVGTEWKIFLSRHPDLIFRAEPPIKFFNMDARRFLDRYDGSPIELLYLDGPDAQQSGSKELHEGFLMGLSPYIAPAGIVLLDDTFETLDENSKGAYAVPWALQNGYWKVVSLGGQMLLAKATRKPA